MNDMPIGVAAGAAEGMAEPVDDRRAYVLARTSSEVHLLLDNLSANPETTISGLIAAHPAATLEPDWLEQVCRITWPPDAQDDSLATQAEQAALLIRVKDYLNSLAKPASGATIAFTLMVTQDEDEDQPSGPDQARALARRHSRSSLAREAYPDLQQKARYFRSWMKAMGLILASILAVTCLLSWYAALGNAALADMSAAQKAVEAAELRVRGDAGAVSETAATARTPAAAAECPSEAKDIKSTNPLADVCLALVQARAVRDQARSGLNTWALWGNETTARWTLNVLGSAILPVFYGFIGAAAAIVRSLSRKTKAGLLSPRDRHLSLQQLALGAVVGACIGLFIAGPDQGGGTDMALLGPVALSSSAISFLAGFGVEAVFNAIEALIGRIFNVAPPAVATAMPVVVPVAATGAPSFRSAAHAAQESKPAAGPGGAPKRLPTEPGT